MLTDNDLSDYYTAMEPVYQKALDDIKWDLDQFIKRTTGDIPADVQRAFNTARITQRVKSLQSFMRKCRREQVNAIDEIPKKIEDILGIRISTANKEATRTLWEYLRGNQKPTSWFCEIEADPNFVPYTIEDRNTYSQRSGYQAYHITFTCKKHYQARPDVEVWPVEMQIMSRLWEFWAEYSREYFYGREGSTVFDYLPYNVAISKLLDSADDLMTATTDQIQREVVEDKKPAYDGNESSQEVVSSQESEGHISLEAVRQWFDNNLSRYFGNARIPGGFFLSKIADELSIYGITLEELSAILEDKTILQTYSRILSRSSLQFLPPHEQILTKILLHLDHDEKSVIDEVNQELRRLGIVLYPSTY